MQDCLGKTGQSLVHLSLPKRRFCDTRQLGVRSQSLQRQESQSSVMSGGHISENKSHSSNEARKSRSQAESIEIDVLEDLVKAAVISEGHSEEDAKLITEVLLWAHLRGNNQGLAKIASGAVALPKSRQPIEVEQASEGVQVWNGGNNYGMVVLQKATHQALEMCRSNGIGTVGVNHTSTSTGALGFYTDLIARDGYIGIALAQSPEYVAPYGSSEAIYGTNPIAISIPAGHSEAPITFDMATSSMAWYGLIDAKNAGKEVAGDIGFDSSGKPSTNPEAILNGGALRNFTRDHKGGGMGFILELLSGALVGGAIQDKIKNNNWGSLVVAIDSKLFGSPAEFIEKVQQLVKRVKGSRKEEGVQDILLPARNGAAGSVAINSKILKLLKKLTNTAKSGQDQMPSQNCEQSAATSSTPSGSFGQRLAVAVSAVEHSNSQDGTPDLTSTKIEAQEEFNPPPAEPESNLQKMSPSTRLLHPPSTNEDPYLATSAPIYQTATFAQPTAVDGGPYDYTRSGNPTRTQLEAQLAELEEATRSFVYTSGMAALSAVLRLAPSGSHVVAGDDVYGGTSRLLAKVAPNLGLEVTHVDTTDLKAVKAVMRPGQTKLLMLESPTNPRMQVCDLKALTEIAHEAGALSVVDNSILTFMYQRPLDLGADISMTSATKFIGGHSDVMAGVLAVRDNSLADAIYFHQNAEGNGLAPFDSWLLLRGLKTMGIRMEKSICNAEKIVAYLNAHPLVKRVNYPTSAGHPNAEVQIAQASTGGSILSFDTENLEASKEIVEQTKLFKITVSFGNVISVISLPCFMSHASIPADVRAARGLPDSLVRISVGIEDPDDLIKDLDQAMQKAMHKIGLEPKSHILESHGPQSEKELELLAKIHRLEDQLKLIKS